MTHKILTLGLLLLTATAFAGGNEDDCPCAYDCDLYTNFYAFIDSVDRFEPNKGYILANADMRVPAVQEMATAIDEAYDMHLDGYTSYEEFLREVREAVGRLQLPGVQLIKETAEFYIFIGLSASKIEEGMVEVRAPYKRIYFHNIDHYNLSGGKYEGPHMALEIAVNPKFNDSGKPIKESYWYHALIFHEGDAYVDRTHDRARWSENWRKLYFLGKPKNPRRLDLASVRGLCLALCYTPGQTVLPLPPISASNNDSLIRP